MTQFQYELLSRLPRKRPTSFLEIQEHAQQAGLFTRNSSLSRSIDSMVRHGLMIVTGDVREFDGRFSREYRVAENVR